MGSSTLAEPPSSMNVDRCKVEAQVSEPFFNTLKASLKETLFPDDPLRQFRNQPASRKVILGLQYLFPFLEWAPRYNLEFLKSDLIAGITVASLAIPQGISYAKLAGLPPILGLYSSFVPPLVYAMMGTSKDLAIGNVAVGSLLMAATLGRAVSPMENPNLYIRLTFTATFFAGLFEAALGFLRLGFMVDFLSHATIVGFMGGAATIVSLQQLKEILGLEQFTQSTDIVSVMRSIFSQTRKWRWESAVFGSCFLICLLLVRLLSKRKPKYFWISAIAPLTTVILGSLLVFFTHAHRHGIHVIGDLKKGLNPASISDLELSSPHVSVAFKTGIITGIIVLAEGIAAGRSFAMLKNYNIDGNKEMVAFGMMNIFGSFTSCFITTGPFSRSAVNYNAGCKTAASNIVMAVAVMITLLFLTQLLYYTPLVVLSSIIVSAMLGLIDYPAAIHLWRVDKFDFVVCICAYAGTVFGSIEIGLTLAVGLSMLRVLLSIARPRTSILGNLPNSNCYRSINQYPSAHGIPGLLILEIGASIYFTNAGYLRERITRWVDEEEERLKSAEETALQYVILDMGAVGSMDTSGIGMVEEVKRMTDHKGLKLVLANPGGEVMKKLDRSRLLQLLERDGIYIYLTIGDAVEACSGFMFYNKGKANLDAAANASNV